MGFNADQAAQALRYTGSVEDAINSLLKNGENGGSRGPPEGRNEGRGYVAEAKNFEPKNFGDNRGRGGGPSGDRRPPDRDLRDRDRNERPDRDDRKGEKK